MTDKYTICIPLGDVWVLEIDTLASSTPTDYRILRSIALENEDNRVYDGVSAAKVINFLPVK